MVDTLQWLALEVKYLDRAQSFYEAFLELDVARENDTEAALDAGGTELILRTPSGVPRGGLHTHYACSIPRQEYDSWYNRLDERFDLVEESFGDSKSLYFYDTEGNCVELGQSDVAGPGVDGIFEVVFEVEDLASAESFYERLGFETVDTGEDRKRVRMRSGSFDIELWEPHLGLADARGGVHVDVGIGTVDPAAVAERVSDDALATEAVEAGYRIRDPDGHYISLVEN
jgi:catechol 2,3-dioxygenase-like lactoylglutathione lyase family enzyme